MAHGPVENGLIEVGKLTLVILYACQVRPWQRALRLAGFSGKPVPWGVRWGGPDQCRFVKDLLLQPVPGGPGLRLDVADPELLTLALQLHGELDRAVRYGRVREQVQLPKLWAAFDPATAASITGDGPELAAYAAADAADRLDVCCPAAPCAPLDLGLFPLAWVSHRWGQAVTIFADLDRFPGGRFSRMERLPDDLAGFHGAAEFDFGGRPSATGHRRYGPKKPSLATA